MGQFYISRLKTRTEYQKTDAYQFLFLKKPMKNDLLVIDFQGSRLKSTSL